MRKVAITTYFIYLLWMLFIAFNLNNITFGHGLGDIFFYIILSIAFLLISIYMIINIMRNISIDLYYTLATGIMVIIMIYFTLHATYLRGSEYSWNGSVFINNY